jgi:hypothetical protein
MSSTETTTKVTTPTESTYKGLPLLVLPGLAPNSQPFQFGITKAKIMLKYVKEIEAFVSKHDAKRSQEDQIKKLVTTLRAKGSTDDEIKDVLGVSELPV